MSATPEPRMRIPPSTQHLPRILCLHGGGVNAEVFAMQARVLIWTLAPHFRLVFADGPHFCDPHPDIVTVYGDYGPFRRWLRWLPEHGKVDDDAAVEEIMYSVRSAMKADAGTGPWVGLLGFSQGAKIAASLLYDTQCRLRETGGDEFGWKFAVLMQGSHPLVSLSPYSKHPAVANAGEIGEELDYHGDFEDKLSLPTIHVHGLRDDGLPRHRKLLKLDCDPRSAVLIEWDGTHRLPIKTPDVDPICNAIIKVARNQGVAV